MTMEYESLQSNATKGGINRVEFIKAPNSDACESVSTEDTVGESSDTTSSAYDGTSSDGLIVVHESSSAIIHRIRVDDGRTFAAKSLVGVPDPPVDDICRLNNEFNILSGTLAKCPYGVRKVLGRFSEDGHCDDIELGPDSKHLLKQYGRHTVYFEWAEGISLAEWMIQFNSRLEGGRYKERSDREAYIEEIVRLMHCVASALAVVHKSGVLHHDVSAENFIIQPDGAKATIIGFGYATPQSMQEVDDEGENVNDDLFCLGAIYRDLLKAAFVTHTRVKGRNHRTSMSRTSITLMAQEDLGLDGVPPCLSALVNNLTKSFDDPEEDRNSFYLADPQYTSATEVAEVLSRMLGNPGAYFNPQNQVNKQSMHFQSNLLCGRSEEVRTLLGAYQALSCPDPVADVRPRMVVVTGSAGVGKSTLVKRLGSYVDQTEKGIFAYGKYDQLRRNKPYSALVAALDSLCEAILQRGDSVRRQAKKDIENAVGSEIGVLMQLVPSLPRILAEKEGKPIVTKVTALHGVEAQNRFKFVFRMFARALASRERPMVLALDDLHWADEASLHLIRSIVTDKSNSSPLLIVVAYRHDEVGEDHQLIDAIMGVDGKTEIKVDNLNFDELNVMVSDVLGVPRLVTCNTLTGVILRKTLGNVFFARQFLQTICDDNLLWFDSKPGRWACDMAGISSLSVTDNVLDLLTNKIRERLSKSVREVLELAACLGSVFDMATLHLLFSELHSAVSPTGQATEEAKVIDDSRECHDLKPRIDTLVKEGLVVMISHDAKYRFAHDRIQQAAYAVVSPERRAALHLRIGELIWKSLKAGKQKWESSPGAYELFFLAIDQMNKGSSEIFNKGTKVEVAELNLKAGQICIEKAAFQQAASYLKMGISLINLESCFEEHYSLSLKLHDAIIEAAYCNGRFDEMEVMVERVLTDARTFDDKLHAYRTLLRALGTQHKIREAIETGLEVLEKLGKGFPKKDPIPKSAALIEMAKTKMVLKGKSDEKLLSLPPMINKRKCAVMQILATLMMYAYMRRKDLVPLFVCRMVRISIRYGISEATAFAFSSFGMILVGALGDVQGGFRFGRLALAFLERSATKCYVAKVNLTVHYIINHWTMPLSQSVQPLLHSSRVGMETGDNDYAMTCALTSLVNAFYSGESLYILEEKSRVLYQQMVDYRIEAFATRILPLWQMILNLMGKSADPLVLTGEAMDRDKYIADAQRNNATHVNTLVHLYSSYLACFFGEYELAAQSSEKVCDVKETILGSFHACEQAYVEGLSAIALARSTKKKEWKRVAQRAFKRIKKWSGNSPNLPQKRLLLEAEFAASNGKKSKAIRMYEAAAAAAARIGCTQDEALSYEKAALFFLKNGDAYEGFRCFVRAHQCYLKWGAQCKADHLYSQHMILSS